MATDEELVQEVLQGHRESFGELVRRYQGMVFGLAYHLLGHATDAQDAAQQSFIAAYQKLDRLIHPEKFAAWLQRITVNECRIWQRGRRDLIAWEELSPDLPSPAASPSEAAEREELRQRVRQAIGRLPEAQRLAVTLYYLDGLSYQEVARFLDVPVSAIKSRLHRARNQLKEELMDMVSEVLQEQKPGEGFAEAVRQAVPVRIVEPIDLALPVGPEDTVLVYTDDATVRVQGGGENMLRVSGRKVLLGRTEEEARQRSEQLGVSAERRRDVWTHVPHSGERWCGTGTDDGKPRAYYTSSRDRWESWKQECQREETLADFLPDLLKGEVVTVVAAGNRIDGLTVPYPLTADFQSFQIGCAHGGEGWAFGPAASVALTVTVPPCRHVILVEPREAEVEGLVANLIVLGSFTTFTARQIQGNVFAHFGAAPTELEEVTGDVWVQHRLYRGVEWRVDSVRRVGDVLTARVRNVGGSVKWRGKMMSLNLQGIAGDLDVENDFGRTKLFLSEAWAEGHTAKIASISGPVALTLQAAADDRLRVGIWTECGTIDRRRWPRGQEGFCYNTPERIYLGTCHEKEGADVEIRTRSGEVRVVRKEEAGMQQGKVPKVGTPT